MAMTAKDTGLVPGVPLEPAPMVTVKALRGFFYEGKAVPPGEVLQVPARFANLIISSQKAVAVEAAPAALPETPAPAALPAPDPEEQHEEQAEEKPAPRKHKEPEPPQKKPSRFAKGTK